MPVGNTSLVDVGNTGEMSLGDIIDNQSHILQTSSFPASIPTLFLHLGGCSGSIGLKPEREKVVHQVASSQVCLSRLCQIGGSGKHKTTWF